MTSAGRKDIIMTVKEKINQLQLLMKQNNIDVYLIPTSDYHQSEYVNEYFQARKYMSGFTGSAGVLVVTLDRAVLFTDGRYFVQAQRQLENTGITLMRQGEKNVPSIEEYVENNLKEGCSLGFDGRVIAADQGIEYEKKYKLKDSLDLVGMLWKDRPKLPVEPVFVLDTKYAGRTAASKLKALRETMENENAQCHILTALDDIAWLLNIRGNDIADNPVVLSYLVVKEKNCILYIDDRKLDETVRKYLEDNYVQVRKYDEIYEDIAEYNNQNIMIDQKNINYRIYKLIENNNKLINISNPTILMKAIKNETEIENEKRAHIKDGVAVTKFLYWLKCNVGKIPMTELSVADKLEEFRKAQEGYIEPSFETICAYGENAAMVHYSASTGNNAKLEKAGAVLIDSGGQYYEGTTDVTRTIGLGAVSEEFKKHYTAVLKGMLKLANARFLKGCSGYSLDILAREALWNMGADYKHGTGHGVGYLLNVHESPNAFRWRYIPGKSEFCVLEPGMITSDEPGVYIEGKYGIRTENEIVVVKDIENEYGEFLKFEMLTMIPIDRSIIDYNYMEREDIERLNAYHSMVYKNISEYLSEEEKKWFKTEFLDKMM